jgi:formate-dependent nitrite reductase membrane component NrfD
MALANPPHFLAADLGLRFRPQREWVEGRGLFLIVAHFLSGAGAGAWLFASLGDGLAGLGTGWALVALSGLFHLLFLGRWTRFARMIARPHSSWISRGLLGLTLLLFTGGAYLALALLGQADRPVGLGLWWVSLLGAAWVLVYKGFVWASAKGIPLWNTPLLPVLYLTYGLRGGLATLLLVALAQPHAGELVVMETLKLWLGVSSALLVLFYLSVIRGTGLTAARSVEALLSGAAAPVFYAGVVLLGLVVPIALGGYALLASVGTSLLAVVGVASLLGDLALLYAVARAGLYRPLPA